MKNENEKNVINNKITKDNKIGIYIHIPFCKNKCKYCSFISGNYKKEIQDKYFHILQNEIKSSNFSNRIVKSIYFGGGTPSFVDKKYIIETLNTIKNNFQIDNKAEISLEGNPNSVDNDNLNALKQNGFSRLSIGAQSFRDDILNCLGRQHSPSQIYKAVALAKKIGFENIGIDYMIGVKKLNENIFKKNIEKLKNLGLKHISIYMLMLEKNTQLYDEMKRNLFNKLNDDECVDDYNSVVNILQKFGFKQYEISNFALDNFQCQHNLNYWNCGEFLGFGVSAHSYINDSRIENTNDITKYLQVTQSENDKDLIESSNKSIIQHSINKTNANMDYFYNMRKIKKLTRKEKIEELIMLSLRTNKGLTFSSLKKLGFDILKEKAIQIELLKTNKFINLTKTSLRINPKFFSISNSIILKLLP